MVYLVVKITVIKNFTETSSFFLNLVLVIGVQESSWWSALIPQLVPLVTCRSQEL